MIIFMIILVIIYMIILIIILVILTMIKNTQIIVYHYISCPQWEVVQIQLSGVWPVRSDYTGQIGKFSL